MKLKKLFIVNNVINKSCYKYTKRRVGMAMAEHRACLGVAKFIRISTLVERSNCFREMRHAERKH